LNISVRVNKKDVLLAGLLAPLQAAPFFIYACLFGGGEYPAVLPAPTFSLLALLSQ
jgi:hypothetical protein